ncbi:MAG: hypothetical protein FJ161_01230 [Gammaproteobacteria bacterium]|nr:hypothetical protein [Gammaproteobacteria bacterium]
MSPFSHSFASILRKTGKKALSFFLNNTDVAATRVECIYKYRTFLTGLKEKISEELSTHTQYPVYCDYKKHDLTGKSCWVVDCILGEKNFVTSLQPFSLMLTEFIDGQANSVAIFDPYTDDLITAASDRGSFLGHHKLKIRPTDYCDIGFTNSANSAMLLSQTGCAIRLFGCPEMEIAWLCQGKADLCFYESFELHPGLRLLIQESQGTFFSTRVDRNNKSFCVIGHKGTIQLLLKSPLLSKVFAGEQWVHSLQSLFE